MSDSQVKVVSEEAKAKKAAYEKQLKERKKAARVKVLQFVKDNAEKLGPLADDIKLLAGGGGGAQVARVPGVSRSVIADLRAAFKERGKLTEMEVFKTFHIGRPEMANKMKALVLVPNPADRLWVSFDDKAEVYSVVGTGATPPAGFTGYVPADKVL